MKQRIRRVSPLPLATVLGILYAILGLVMMPIFLFIASMAPEEAGFGTGFVLAMPILYGLIGFIFTAVGAALYNLVAGWVGGVEVDLEPGPSTPMS